MTADATDSGPRAPQGAEAVLAADPREATLPKWARDKLTAARMVAHGAAVEARAATLATQDRSDTFLSPSRDTAGQAVGLGTGTRVLFSPGGLVDPADPRDLRQITCHLDERTGLLTVHGMYDLAVMPHTANIVHVKSGRTAAS